MKKITVRLNALNWDLFDQLINMVGLRRDTYLAKVLPAELAEIRSQAWANDEAGENYLRGMTTLFGQTSKQVTISLPPDLVSQIDSLSTEKRIPRDRLLDAILQFIAYRVFPFAVVLSEPRYSMKFESQNELLAAVLDRLGIDSIEEYNVTLADDYYRQELHYTKELIVQIEATFNEIRETVASSKRRASDA